MRGPGPNHDALYGCATVRTGQVSAPVDPELGHVVTGVSVGEEIGEVVEGGPPIRDCRLEDVTDRGEEATEGFDVEFTTWGQRMDPGAVEGLVGVDVSQTRDWSLVEKQSLDRGGASGETIRQIRGGGGIRQGVGSETTDP